MTDITLPAERELKATTQATVVEQSRAVAEVAAMVRVAQDNPRDVSRAVEQMRQACSQRALADRAFYSLPRAGGRVEGSTVHLARELARCWGNLEFGIREVRRDDVEHVSEVLAWAWDTEANTRQSRSFVVPHARMRRKEREVLTDLADIANNNNSQAARALRECILTILPVWFRQDAETIAARTLAGESADKPPEQQIADATGHFANLGVTIAQLEARLNRPRKQWLPGDVAVLRVLASEISRGEKDITDEFPEQPIDVAALEPTEADQ